LQYDWGHIGNVLECMIFCNPRLLRTVGLAFFPHEDGAQIIE
jgi:hypothetical protein